MAEIDKRHLLEQKPFDYRLLKDGRVLLYYEDRHVKTLAGKHAQKFLTRLDGLDDFEIQLLLAKETGNFKRGNERLDKDTSY